MSARRWVRIEGAVPRWLARTLLAATACALLLGILASLALGSDPSGGSSSPGVGPLGCLPTGPTNTSAPTLTPTGTQPTSTTLTLTEGTWTDECGIYLTTFSYTWYRDGTQFQTGTFTSGSTTYITAGADIGHTITAAVTVCDTNTDCTTANATGSATVACTLTNTQAPVMSPSSSAGSDGTSLSTTNGSWSDTCGGGTRSYSYQWLRDGAAISGQTAASYTTTSADNGHTVTVSVTATDTFNGVGVSQSATASGSYYVAPAPSNTSAPTFSGRSAIDSNVYSTDGSWSSLLPITSTSYQWQRCGYRSTVLADSPANWWRLGDSSLSRQGARDELLATNGSYASGGVTYGVAGALASDPNTAVTLNGSSGYLTVSTGPQFDSGNFTIEAWFKTSSSANQQIWSSGSSGGNQRVSLLMTAGKLQFVAEDSSAHTVTLSPTQTYNNGAWHQVLVTRNGNTFTLYADNHNIKSQNVSGVGDVDASGTSAEIGLGTFSPNNGYYFNGSLDEVSVYKSALSSSRIGAHYNAATNLTSGCANISGATSSTYTQSGNDFGNELRVQVTKCNADGCGTSPYSSLGAWVAAADLGQRREYSDVQQKLTDQESLSVNVANGNVTLTANDLHLPGIAGFGLDYGRYYNSEYSASSNAPVDTLAPGWETLPTLNVLASGNVRYTGQSGYEVTFTLSGSTYATPPGVDATLVKQGDGTFVLTFDQAGNQQLFSTTGLLTAYKDRNGNTISFSRSGGQLSSITDTTGRTTSFTYNGAGQLTTITAPGICNSQTNTCTYSYGYDGSGNLTSFTDPTGAVTSYAYTAGLLTQVTDPDLNATKISYDASNRVTSIQGGLNSSGTCPTGAICPLTTFSYAVAPGAFSACSNPTTDVTAPNQQSSGTPTRYCFDSQLRVTAVKAPTGDVTSTDYTSAHGGSNCTDGNGNSLDDRPCSTTSGRGYVTTYGYDSSGRNLVWEQNPVQTSTHRSSWVFGDSGHPYYPTSFTDADGNVTSYTYTAAGNLATTTDGVGYQTSYSYLSNGELASETHGLNSSGTCPSGDTCPTMTYNTYDGNGDLTEKTDALGHVSTYGFDAAGDQTSETDGLNSSLQCPSGDTCPTTSESYDADGRLLTETNARGYTTQYSYDAVGNKTSETDGLSYNSSTQTYYCPSGATCPATSESYANNRLLSKTDPNNHTTQYGYDPNGNLLTMTDADGNQTLYGYDGLNRRTSEQTGLNSSGTCPTGSPAPICPTTTYIYDSDGNQIGEVNPQGYGSHSAFDGAEELLTKQDGLTYSGQTYSCASGDTCPTTTYGYDLAGNQTSVLDGNGSETVTAYDGDNRAQSVTQGYQYDSVTHTYDCLSGKTCPETSYGYDNNGNRATVTDPDGFETSSLYNADNQVTSVTSGLNSSGQCPSGTPTPVCPQTTYTYDNVGNKSTVEKNAEPGTPTTSYAYYPDGSLDTVTDPMGNVTTDTYDNVGNLVSQQTPKGTTTSCYNAGGELLSTYYSVATCGQGTPDVSYSYDAAGNRLVMSTAGAFGQITETSHYTNRELPGTVTTSEPISGSSTLNAQFQYSYNANGDVTQQTYPDGTNVYYNYNNRDLLCRVGSASGSSCSAASNYVAYSYDGDNNLQTSTHPSGSGNFVESRSYDNAERLSGVSTTSGSNTVAAFTYTLDASGNATNTVRTGWNPLGSNWSLNCSMTGSYDNNERLTSSAYTSGTNGCPTQNNDAYSFNWSYDADGNWTNSVGAATTYYKLNAGDQICASSSSGPPSSCGSSFTYDGNGNETTDGLTGNTYVFNLANQMTSATAQGATSTATYDGDGKQLSQTANGTTTYYFWDINTPGQPQLALAEDNTGSVTARYLYGVDRLSVTSGGTTQDYVYDGLGSTTNLVSGSGVINSTYEYDPYGGLRYSDGSSQTTTFAGLLSSSVSNLDASTTRYYDTNTGRFLSQDPAGTSGVTAGTYLYANDSPAAYTDPGGTTTASGWAHCPAGSIIGWPVGGSCSAISETKQSQTGTATLSMTATSYPSGYATYWYIVKFTNWMGIVQWTYRSTTEVHVANNQVTSVVQLYDEPVDTCCGWIWDGNIVKTHSQVPYVWVMTYTKGHFSWVSPWGSPFDDYPWVKMTIGGNGGLWARSWGIG